MSTNNFIIDEHIATALHTATCISPVWLYVQGSHYFISYANPNEINNLITNIGDWSTTKIFDVYAKSFRPSLPSEQLLSMIAQSASKASKFELTRITSDTHPLIHLRPPYIPIRKDAATVAENMESMNQAFLHKPEAEIVLGKHWYVNDFKAIIEHAKAHNESIVYSYAKGDKQFLSFFSDLGDVSKNGIPVATWLPGWGRQAWLATGSSFVSDMRRTYPHIGQSITSVIGLLAHITLTGVTEPVPIQGACAATDIAAGKVAEAAAGALSKTNVFGLGAMPMTAKNAPPTTEELEKAGYLSPAIHREPSLKITNASISGTHIPGTLNKCTLGPRNERWSDIANTRPRHCVVYLQSARTPPNKSMGETEISQIYPKSFGILEVSADTIKEQIKELSATTRIRAKEQEIKSLQEHMPNMHNYLQSVKERKETQMTKEQFRQSFTQFVDVFTTDFPKTDTTAALKKMLVEKAVDSFMEKNKGKDKPVEGVTNIVIFTDINTVYPHTPFAISKDKNGNAVLMDIEGDTANIVTASKWNTFNHPVYPCIREYLFKYCNLGLTKLPDSDNIVFSNPYDVVIANLTKAQKEKEVIDKSDTPKGITFRGDRSGAAVLQLVKPLFDGSHAVTDATIQDFIESSSNKNTHIDLTKRYLETTFSYTLDLDRFTGKVMVFKRCPVNVRVPVSYIEMVSCMLDPNATAKHTVAGKHMDPAPVDGATDSVSREKMFSGVNKKPEEEIKDTKPQMSALVKLLDPLGDDAGIIDLVDLHAKINADASLAQKEYFLYTHKGMPFISDRDTVGDIFNAEGDIVGNMLSDATCMSMLGSELVRQFLDTSFDTEIDDVEDLVRSMF